jgi:hypothetical protein
MKKVRVVFRGLFVVVREAKHDEAAKRNEAENMLVLFPTGHSHKGGEPAHDDGDSMHPVEHVPTLYIRPDSAAEDDNADVVPMEGASSGYTRIPLPRCELHLPYTGEVSPVKHGHDEEVLRGQPTACSEMEEITGLSRLGNLNELTGSELDPAHLGFPAPNVAVRVILSGGKVCCLPSRKPLGNAFFEFYDQAGLIHVQRLAEDVEFNIETDDDEVTVGFRSLDDKNATIVPIRVPATSEPIFINSFPADAGARCRDLLSTLTHFQLYYPLMQGGRQPNLRYLGRCTDKLTYTMPTIPMTLTTSDPACSCFAAQAFFDPRQRSTSRT